MAAGSQVDSVDGKEAEIPPKKTELYCLEVLQIIREAQQQHGLRHGDYQRYRQYCGRRLRRIRKSLHFPQGTKYKVQPKTVTPEMLRDSRYLYVPLFLAERAWGYAMQLKEEANTEPRKRPHMVARLKKALHHAEELAALCESDKCDARTKLEAQAYASFIKASLHFEKEKWKQAIELFTSTRTIYEKLASALVDEVKDLYVQKCAEISPNIRYCAYNIGDDSAVADLVQMRMKSGGATDSMTSKLDELIEKTRERQAATLSEVTWRGRTVPVRSETVRVCLLSVTELCGQLEDSTLRGVDERLSVYESVLREVITAQQALRDELKDDPTFKSIVRGKQGSSAGESRVPNSVFLHSYLGWLRYTKTVERHLLMIESLKANMTAGGAAESSKNKGSKPAAQDKKVTKPQDLARLYDIIIQSLGEITSLPGLEDDTQLLQEMSAQTIAYKAFRCYFVAQTYLAAKKYRECLALYERVTSYAEQASNSLTALKMDAAKKNAEVSGLKQLIAEVDGAKYSCHANSILDSEAATSEQAPVLKTNKLLEDRLDDYYEDPVLASPRRQTSAALTRFPPDFQPVPCKPLFFDVALSKVEFPSLESKLEQRKPGAGAGAAGGITGLVKGWLWGGKK